MAIINVQVWFGPELVEWRQIHSRERQPAPFAGIQDDEPIYVPNDMFHWNVRVLDEYACDVVNGIAYPVEQLLAQGAPIPPNSVVVLLESPHRSEYEVVNGAFLPIRPLNDAQTRNLFYQQVPEVLAQMDLHGQPVPVILCNPVPYQCSLQRLMQEGIGLQSAIRNAVWRDLFAAGFQHEFVGRLVLYEPLAVLNACTYSLRNRVQGAVLAVLQANGNDAFGFWTCNHHPCAWNLPGREIQMVQAALPG